MSYKVFDFKCPICGYVLENQMYDEEHEPIPFCPECETLMEKQIGTDWVRHISWSSWNATH